MAGYQGSWGAEEWQEGREERDDDVVRVIRGEQVEPWKTFDACCGSWKFPNGLMGFLVECGFAAPTPIQAWTWPVLVGGSDVIGVAKTGSGKTLGYLLPGYIKVKRADMIDHDGTQPQYNSWSRTKPPKMLVISPTRELCQQIFDESVKFGEPAMIRTACVYGGAPKGPQQQQLYTSPECIVGTPGRLTDFVQSNTLSLNEVIYLVLDEADRMLDMGFKDQIQAVISGMPPTRQTALFTATWPREVRELAEQMIRNPTHIQVGNSESFTTNADIIQEVVKVRNNSEKMQHLDKCVFSELKRSTGAALIFVKTKRTARDLHWTLSSSGAPAVALHGDMDQHQRDASLAAFKTGKAKLLVATDVAQRGLDIKNVQIVVNYDPPSNGEDYVHRIGRTGRAGEKGTAITFLTDTDASIASQILKVVQRVGQTPSGDLLEVVRSGGSIYGGYGGGKGGGGGQYSANSNMNGSWDNWKSPTNTWQN